MEVIIEKLKNAQNKEECFLENEEYPDIENALISLLCGCNIDIVEKDIEVLSSEINIDADGYPFIKKCMKVSKLGVVIAIIAYHHNNWDFYIDNITNI